MVVIICAWVLVSVFELHPRWSYWLLPSLTAEYWSTKWQVPGSNLCLCQIFYSTLGRIKCMRCRLLLPIIAVSVSLYVTQPNSAYCAKTAKWINILFGMNTPGSWRNIVLDVGPDPPQRGGGMGKISPILDPIHISRWAEARDLEFYVLHSSGP